MNETELNNLLGKIGKRIFVEYFSVFGDLSISANEVIDLLPYKYTLKSRASRTYKSRRIFREGLEKEALFIISNSDRVELETVLEARALLEQLQSG
jgi:hypothetical protein